MANMETWARYAAENHWEGMVATGWSRYSGTTTYCELWQAAPMSLYLAAEVMRKGHFEPGDWDRACCETLGIDSLAGDWATQRFPRNALDAAGGSGSPALAQLKAIAAVHQWRRDAHSVLADRWQALGFHEDPALRNEQDLGRVRKAAGEVEARWEEIAVEFERVMQADLHASDIRDYLASRRRMGMEALQVILGAK